MHLLPLNLACVADHASSGDSRWSVDGIQVELQPNNAFRVVATDTKQLLQVDGFAVGDASDYPTWPGLETAPNGHAKALIPAKGWKAFFQSATKTAPKRTTKPELRSRSARKYQR